VSGAGCPRVTHPFAALPSEGLPLPRFPLDLHVLGTPPAFVLSQDQTLRREPSFGAHLFRWGRLWVRCESRPRRVALPARPPVDPLLFPYDRQSLDATKKRRPSLDGETHWLLAHCSVLKVRAATHGVSRRSRADRSAYERSLHPSTDRPLRVAPGRVDVEPFCFEAILPEPTRVRLRRSRKAGHPGETPPPHLPYGPLQLGECVLRA
jgi:hypothetical protein